MWAPRTSPAQPRADGTAMAGPDLEGWTPGIPSSALAPATGKRHPERSERVRSETLAIHAGRAVDDGTGAVAEPITLSVTYERDPDGTYPRGYFYTTAGNPNRESLEARTTALEDGAEAVAFASGSMAIGAVLRTCLKPGDHVVVPTDVFQGTVRLLADVLAPWGVTWTSTETTELDSVRSAIRDNTKLVCAETLSNPLLKVADISGLAEIAHASGALLAVDNTFVTPIFQRPLQLGADLVVHASTKYLGGHGDVAGGIVVARQNGSQTAGIRMLQRREGGVPSPFDCWLVQRGIKTLSYRMRAHAGNALEIARFLQEHPLVETVHYPGLESHPQHQLALLTLDGFGGIVSFQVRGDADLALRIAGRTELFTHATSLGQAESLIQHQASSPTHGPGTELAENLLRLSVGLEHPDDLIDDLRRAMASTQPGPG